MNQSDLLEKQEEWADTIEVKPRIKTNIKMRVTEEQKKKIGEIYPLVRNFPLRTKYIFIYDKFATWSDKEHKFKNKLDIETVDADLFIRTNGTCIEENQEDYKNAHYKSQKIDTVARCKANMTLEQQKAICIFNCDKYLHREKGQNLEDIQKVRYYLDWLEEIENKLKDKE